MSTWYSWRVIGHDDDGMEPPVGDVRSYAHGWSNHYPTTDGDVERPAWIEVDYLPPFCVPGHEDDEDTLDEDARGPWLRLSVYALDGISFWRNTTTGEPHSEQATVVLDETAVQALHDALGEWLAAPKVRPT